jgi:hypothetical protein
MQPYNTNLITVLAKSAITKNLVGSTMETLRYLTKSSTGQLSVRNSLPVALRLHRVFMLSLHKELTDLWSVQTRFRQHRYPLGSTSRLIAKACLFHRRYQFCLYFIIMVKLQAKDTSKHNFTLSVRSVSSQTKLISWGKRSCDLRD